MGSTALAQSVMLGAVFDDVTYVQLHVGPPGPECLFNWALEDRRQPMGPSETMDGVFRSPNELLWVAVAADETFTHLSLWQYAVRGEPLWSGEMDDPISVRVGENFVIPAGALTVMTRPR